MRLKTIIYTVILGLLFVISCNRDDISFDAPTQQLRFSKDTVLLDTVYNQVRSETYAVKIYNDENKDIQIPRIALEGGASSPYRLNLDGKAGTEFLNVPLRKKDSLYIFVEIAPVAQTTEAIAEDKISFSTNQKITLLSVVQDAEFFIQSSGNPNVINQDLIWKNDKAKIIYGNLTLAEGKTLNIEKGTKIYFYKNSGMKISKNATLNINGDIDEEVILRGDRNDPKYDTIPMNWKGIEVEENATINMNYAKIFGGETGLKFTNAKADIQNSIIHTFQDYGILAINSSISAKNLVMNNCGEACFAVYKGGNIEILHSTLANYWSLNSAMAGLSLFASNEWTSNTTTETAPLSLNVQNSILYSRRDNGVVFKQNTAQTFTYKIANSLLKYGNNAGFDFDGNVLITQSIKNESPEFQNYFTQKMNLRLKENSPAKGKGNSQTAQQIPLDIKKINRTISPNMGAYQ